MELLYAIGMGIVQGLAEFLPISSSGHLVIFQMLFGETAFTSGGGIFYEVLLHFGTLVAVFVAFWGDIKAIIVDFCKMIAAAFRKEQKVTPNSRMALLIIVSLLPLIIILPFKSKIEALFSVPWIIGVMLIVTALLLVASDFLPKGKKNASNAKFTDALFVGVCQLFAVTPGLSRSGTTITAGLFRGFGRDFAVRFSFIMSIPTVLAAVVLEFADGLKAFDPAYAGMYIAGFLASAVSGYLAIRLVRLVAKKNCFKYFAIYCAAMGIFTIIWSLCVK